MEPSRYASGRTVSAPNGSFGETVDRGPGGGREGRAFRGLGGGLLLGLGLLAGLVDGEILEGRVHERDLRRLVLEPLRRPHVEEGLAPEPDVDDELQLQGLDVRPRREVRLVVDERVEHRGAAARAGDAARAGGAAERRVRGRRGLRGDLLGRPDQDERLAALRERAALPADCEALVGRLHERLEALAELVGRGLEVRVAPGPEERDELLGVVVRRDLLPLLLLGVGREELVLGRLFPVLVLVERGGGRRGHGDEEREDGETGDRKLHDDSSAARISFGRLARGAPIPDYTGAPGTSRAVESCFDATQNPENWSVILFAVAVPPGAGTDHHEAIVLQCDRSRSVRVQHGTSSARLTVVDSARKSVPAVRKLSQSLPEGRGGISITVNSWRKEAA